MTEGTLLSVQVFPRQTPVVERFSKPNATYFRGKFLSKVDSRRGTFCHDETFQSGRVFFRQDDSCSQMGYSKPTRNVYTRGSLQFFLELAH